MASTAAPSSQWIGCSAARNGRCARPLNSVVRGQPIEGSAVQSNSRIYPVVWLAVGGTMAAMYAVNGIQASSPAYFVIAFGWGLLGAAQWWRLRSAAASGGTSETVASRKQLALYVTIAAFFAIAGGLAARWWA